MAAEAAVAVPAGDNKPADEKKKLWQLTDKNAEYEVKNADL